MGDCFFAYFWFLEHEAYITSFMKLHLLITPLDPTLAGLREMVDIDGLDVNGIHYNGKELRGITLGFGGTIGGLRGLVSILVVVWVLGGVVVLPVVLPVAVIGVGPLYLSQKYKH